jgi:hypothetical protein
MANKLDFSPLKEEHKRMKVYEVLKRIFGPKRDGV